jgi:hypothetical protein
MSDRQLELAARRAELLAQSTAHREQLKLLAGDIQERLAGVDRAIEVARAVAKKPTVIAGAIAMVSFIGPGRVLRALTRSAMFIATGRRVVSLFRGRGRGEERHPSLVRKELSLPEAPTPSPPPLRGGGGVG